MLEIFIPLSLFEMFIGVFIGALIILSETRHVTWFDDWSPDEKDWVKFWFWFFTCGGIVSLINVFIAWLFT